MAIAHAKLSLRSEVSKSNRGRSCPVGRGCNYVFLMFDSDSMVLLALKDYGRSTIFYACFLYQSELWLGREGVRKSGLIEKTVTVFVEPCFILFYKQTQTRGSVIGHLN